MGTWGTALLSDDFALDIYDNYMEHYNDGLAHEAIREQLLDEFAEALIDPDEEPVFWLALAKAQWECGALQDDVYQRVKAIVETGEGLELWEEDMKLLRKRKQVLQKFLQQIGTPKEKPRKRRKEKKYEAIYVPGDCLAVRLSDGGYGAAIVLAADNSHKTEGMNLIGLLAYKGQEKPSLDIFERHGIAERHGIVIKQRNWLKLTHHNWNEKQAIYWCMASIHKKAAHLFEVIGNVALSFSDPKTSLSHTSWEHLGEQIVRQSNWDRGIRD